MSVSIVRVPGWGFSYDDACYYGRWHSLHLGPWLFFFGQMTDAEIEAWGAEQETKAARREAVVAARSGKDG